VEAIRSKQDRDVLATAVAAGERKIADHRQAMDGQTQQQFDLQRKLGDAQADLTQLRQMTREATNANPEPIQVASYSTPISKTVEGDEVHLRLRGGRMSGAGTVPLIPIACEGRPSIIIVWRVTLSTVFSGSRSLFATFRNS